MQSTFHKALTNTLKKLFKKWSQNGPLSWYAQEINFHTLPAGKYQSLLTRQPVNFCHIYTLLCAPTIFRKASDE